MKYAGIDVSKKELHVAVLEPAWDKVYPNTPAGHRDIVRKLEGCRVVVEATARYHEGVVTALFESGGEIMVANPRTTRNFAKALDQRGKTDSLDRLMLARFAAAMPFKQWVPPRKEALTLRSLMRRRQQLVEQLAMEKTRLAEAKCDLKSDPFITEDIEANIQHLQQRIQGMEERALECVTSDSELEHWYAQLNSIPGVAAVTAMAIMAELGCLPDDMDVRQLTAYAGLDPQPWQSGRMDAARRISKRGNKRLRTTLYMAAWNVARCSPQVGQWRQHLIDRGKAPKQADIAVARRLLNAVVGMRRNASQWDGARFYSPPTGGIHAA